jgi:hypothetical protein
LYSNRLILSGNLLLLISPTILRCNEKDSRNKLPSVLSSSRLETPQMSDNGYVTSGRPPTLANLSKSMVLYLRIEGLKRDFRQTYNAKKAPKGALVFFSYERLH